MEFETKCKILFFKKNHTFMSSQYNALKFVVSILSGSTASSFLG